jgi:hypothetical protein
MRQERPRVTEQLELEERGCNVRVRGAALVPAECSDLVTARVRKMRPASI